MKFSASRHDADYAICIGFISVFRWLRACLASANPSGPGADNTDQVEIQTAIDARIAAKSAKNYAEADRIRDELKAQGIELIDKSGGITEWIRR